MTEQVTVEHITDPDITVLHFAGIIDNQIKGQLEEKFRSLATTTILDFSQAARINSMGITVLLKTLKQYHGDGGRVCFVHLNRLNTKLFRMVGLTKMGKIFETMDDAMHYIVSDV